MNLMEVNGSGPINAYAQAAQKLAASNPTTPIGESAQILLLKKLLDAQQQQAAELLQPADGKGRMLDIRV